MKNDGRDIRHELSVKTRSKCRVEMHVSTKVAQTYLLVCGPVVSPVVRRLSCVFSSGVPGILHLTVTAHRKTADSRDITLWLMLFLRRSKVRSPGTKKNGILGPFGGLRAVCLVKHVLPLVYRLAAEAISKRNLPKSNSYSVTSKLFSRICHAVCNGD